MRSAALSYPMLVAKCRDNFSSYKVSDDPTLTGVALAENYTNVARCAYGHYNAKPYWIPALVINVDICGEILGSSWRIITENDISYLTDADFTFIRDTLRGISVSQSFWDTFYFSLKVYVRANDETLKIADLTPGVSSRIDDLPNQESQYSKQHLEGGYALRCIRAISK